MHSRLIVGIILAFAVLTSACDGTYQSGATRAKTFSPELMEQRPNGPFIVFELPTIEGSDYQVVGIHVKNEKQNFDFKKLYKAGTTNAREAIEPGTYQYRVVYVNTNSKILFDTAACNKAAPYSDVTIEGKGSKLVSVKLCPTQNGGTVIEPMVTEFDRLHNPEFEGEGFPSLPRRYLSVGQGKSETTSLSVTLGLKVWDILDLSTTTSTSVSASFRSDVTLIKHAPNPGTILVLPGTSTLAYEEGIAFVAQCNYSGSIGSTTSNGAKIGVSGSLPFGLSVGGDAGRTLAIEKSTSVQALSKMVKVEAGETIEDIRKRCDTIFANEVKFQVERDVKLAAQNSLYADQRDNFELVYEAAVNGPDTDDISANGNSWNVKKAVIAHNGDQMTIAGSFGHRVDMWFDDDFCYKITVEGSDRTKRPRIAYHRYDNCSGHSIDAGWFEAGKNIAKNIAIQAWQSAPAAPTN